MAVVVYFVIVSGGFFGLTIDLTKITPENVQYVYAALSFLSGYFVRRVIEKFSAILDSIFGKDSPTPDDGVKGATGAGTGTGSRRASTSTRRSGT